jgi:peptide/nickel transport system permease protein
MTAQSPNQSVPEVRDAVRRRSRLAGLLTDRAARVGIAIFGLMVIMALLAPLLRPGDPLLITGDPLLWPFQSAAHPLGTDSLGRDLLSGIMYGARVSIMIGVVVAVISIVFGAIIGAAAGYCGGWVDWLISNFIEIFQTIPGFVLLVVLVAFMEPSFVTVIIGLVLISWDTAARLTRAEVRQHRNREYVLAARTGGLSHLRILLSEVLPNIAPTLIVTGSIIVAHAILAESALAFLGLGDPNVASWGSLIGSGREQIRTHWYLTAIPGLFIALTVFALNILGDAINDHLNPRSKG